MAMFPPLDTRARTCTSCSESRSLAMPVRSTWRIGNSLGVRPVDVGQADHGRRGPGTAARGCGRDREAHEAPSDAHTVTSSDGGLYGPALGLSHLPTVRHLNHVTFHSGERLVQRRAGVPD